MKKTQIFHFKFGGKLPLTLVNAMFSSREEQIIDIEDQNQRMILYNLYVKVGINYALGKSKAQQIAINPSIPGSRCLLKPVQSLFELANMRPLLMQLKTFWLLDVDFFFNFSIDSSVEKCKARFVARGFSQKEGIDYDETFTPVARYSSIRAIISLASVMGWKLHQIDVKTAFLNSEIEEDVYIEQPKGF